MSSGPFAATRPALVAAGAHALLALAWLALGAWLPGDRWLAVHLFTLGVLTNAVIAFTSHFALALTRQPGATPSWHTPVLNLGVVAVLVGGTMDIDGWTGVGAGVVTVVVADNLRLLHRLRRTAVGARFGWIVEVQEWAHAAFLTGAVLGIVLATGSAPGLWYLGVRLAHLHLNVLGWGGLTLLSTIVFFGPTMTRSRIVAGADARAAGALRLAVVCLAAAAAAMVATGIGEATATAVRAAAGLLLMVHAGAAAAVCQPVARAAASGAATAPRWHVVAVVTWFPLLAFADGIAIATARWWLLDALGVGMLVAVLGQAVAATAAHVIPTLRERSVRPLVLARLERVATARAVTWNVGAVAVVTAAVLRNPAGAAMATIGWVLVVLALADLAWRALAPVDLSP